MTPPGGQARATEAAGAAAGRIAVAVVSYNTRDLLGACLESARADGAREIVVVDNGSTDGSAAMARERFPEALVVDDVGNRGYGAAANVAVRRTVAEYVLVLNADTVVHPGALDRLARYLDRTPAAAVVGPHLLETDGTTQPSRFPFPGTLGWLVENDPVAPLARLVPGVRRRMIGERFPAGPAVVPWVLGAALAVRREAFLAVGGFDESFFMYFEEVDLCRRLADRGWETHFLPDARVTHVGGASTAQVRASMIVRHFRSNLLFLRRHYRGPRLHFWLAVMRLKMGLRLARDGAIVAARPRRRREVGERLAAWRAALRETGR